MLTKYGEGDYEPKVDEPNTPPAFAEPAEGSHIRTGTNSRFNNDMDTDTTPGEPPLSLQEITDGLDVEPYKLGSALRAAAEGKGFSPKEIDDFLKDKGIEEK